MKKAQMEIMGLLVIVILIIVALLFFLTFDTQNAGKKPESTEFSQEQLTGTFGSTFLETTSTCENKIMREIVSDCAFSKEINCESMNSCEYINKTLEKIANETLLKAGINYTIKISTKNNDIIVINNTGCNSGNTRTKSTPMATIYETMKMDLIICD